MSRLSRGFIKTKVGSWVYSKSTIPKSNPCLSVEVNKMQLQPVGFLGYKHIFLATTMALEVSQHGAMPKGNIHLSESRLWQIPMLPVSPTPSCPFCQHQPLYSDQGMRLKDYNLFPPVSSFCKQARLKATTLTKRMILEHTAEDTSKCGSTGVWI